MSQNVSNDKGEEEDGEDIAPRSVSEVRRNSHSVPEQRKNANVGCSKNFE